MYFSSQLSCTLEIHWLEREAYGPAADYAFVLHWLGIGVRYSATEMICIVQSATATRCRAQRNDSRYIWLFIYSTTSLLMYLFIYVGAGWQMFWHASLRCCLRRVADWFDGSACS